MLRTKYRLVGQFDPLTREYVVGTAVKRGQVVTIAVGTTGLIAPANHTTAASVLGVALADGGPGASVPVVISSDVVYEIDIPATGVTLTNAHLMGAYGLKEDTGSTGDHILDVLNTTYPVAQIIAYENERKVAYVILINRAIYLGAKDVEVNITINEAPSNGNGGNGD